MLLPTVPATPAARTRPATPAATVPTERDRHAHILNVIRASLTRRAAAGDQHAVLMLLSKGW